MSNRTGSLLLALLMTTGSLVGVVVTVPEGADALTYTVTTDDDLNGTGTNRALLDSVVIDGGSIYLAEDKYTVHDTMWSDANAYQARVDGQGRPVLAPAGHWTRRGGYGSDGDYWHTAVWDGSNSQVLVYGGCNDVGNNRLVHNALWAYNPTTDTWTEKQAAIPIFGHTAVWADGYRMMVVWGGFSVSGQNLVWMDQVLCYWPANNSWGWRAQAPVHLVFHAAAWDPVNEQMLVSGGTPDGNISNSTNLLYAWRPATNTWVQLQSFAANLARGAHVAVWDEVRGEMIISGGLKNPRTSRPMSSTLSYNPSTGLWVGRANSPIARFYHAASWDPISKKMYVFGGIDDGWNPSAQFYDFDNAADSWTYHENATATRFLTAFVWDPVNNRGMNFAGAQSGNGPYTSWNDILLYRHETPYVSNGWLTSSIFDVGGILRVGNIWWKPTTQPPACGPEAIRLQVGSSGPLESPTTFYGPDGTTSSYFMDPEGDPVGNKHLGMNRIAYRMYLRTGDSSISPTVTEVGMDVYRYAVRGSYTSPVLDLVQTASSFGRIRHTVEIPTGGNPYLVKAEVSVRTSERPDMTGATGWELVTTDDTSILTPYRRYFQFKVEIFTDSQARYLTPKFKDLTIEYNSPPVLSSAGVDRSEGDRESWFTYKVTYTDVDNDAPTVKNVVIDGKANAMSSGAQDFTRGAVYTFTTRLALGAHTFHFEFSDGKNPVREPLSGSFEGPEVLNRLPRPVIDYPMTGVRFSPDEPVEFSASRSSDPDGDKLTYRWVSSVQGQLSEDSAFVMRLQEGQHTIALEVTDDKGGKNTTQISLLVKPYLPYLDVTDIYFDNTDPVEKDRITVTAVVRNTGEADARPAFVEFLIDMVVVETMEENIDVGDKANVVFQWNAVQGRPLVSVRAKRAVGAVADTEVKRFLNVSANSLPDVRFDMSTPIATKGEAVLFVNNGTRDPDGDALTYLWDFGDGSPTVTDVTVQHVFAVKGTYSVNLTVRDSRGGVTVKTFTVLVKDPPKDDSPAIGPAGVLAALGAAAAVAAVVGARARRRKGAL